MNILITGGTGFIGRNLIEVLNNEYIIYHPSHQELDLRDWKAVDKYIVGHHIDIIIHTAVGKGDNILRDTILMFSAIGRNSDKVKKIIHLGSGAEYGKTRDLKKVKEEDFGKYIPEDDYGIAKYVCSQIALLYPNIITLRLFGVYGKYENYLMKFISNSISKALVGLPIKIKQDVVFDYLFVDDLIEVIKYFITHDSKVRFYNVTPSRSIKLSEIASIINDFSIKKVPVKIIHSGLNFRYTGSNRKLISNIPNLKFRPYIQGIGHLYKFYEKIQGRLNTSKLVEDKFYRIKSLREKR